jgi:hypothetical protein
MIGAPRVAVPVTMTRARLAAATVLALRIAYGAALLAVPERVTKRWLGSGARAPAATVGLRGLGAREVALHAAGLAAAVADRPVRPWLAASIAGDVSDIAATAASGAGLPDGAPRATLVVAGASAVLSAAVAAAVDG